MRAYLRIFKTAIRQEGANPNRLLLGCLMTIFRVSLLAVIYKVAYSYGAASLSYANAIWSFGIYFTFILNLGLRDIFKVMEQDIINGEVETQLVKPVDWRMAKLVELVGKKLPEFILQLILLPIVLLLLVGAPQVGFWSVSFLLSFVILVPLAMICAVCMFMLVGFTAFWLNDAKSVFRILDKTVLILGGGFVPIALLPVALQAFVRFTPIGIYAAPTQLFNPNLPHVLVPTIISAIVWSVILLLCVNFAWQRAQTKLEVNGG
jgi:ABC-2 type transport system permease protein